MAHVTRDVRDVPIRSAVTLACLNGVVLSGSTISQEINVLSREDTPTKMHGVTTLALIGALLLSATAAQTTTNGTTSSSTLTCADGLKMFVSRGTGEDQDTGVIGKITDLIARQIDGSDVQGVAYPATFEDPNYFLSVSNGTQLLRQAIIEYTQACPDSKISLFGYSQVRHGPPQH